MSLQIQLRCIERIRMNKHKAIALKHCTCSKRKIVTYFILIKVLEMQGGLRKRLISDIKRLRKFYEG